MAYRVRYAAAGRPLPSVRIHDELDDAKQEGEKSGSPYVIEEVIRPPLSAFLSWPNILGDMRENMQEKLGDDSQMDEDPLRQAILTGALRKAVEDAIEAFCIDNGIVLQGAIALRVIQ